MSSLVVSFRAAYVKSSKKLEWTIHSFIKTIKQSFNLT